MQMSKLISTAEYAAKHGKSPRVVRQKILDGTLPAVMIGGRYAIKEDEPYIDARITSGKYVGASRSKPAEKREAAIRAERIAEKFNK
jgi:hypothetical protein